MEYRIEGNLINCQIDYNGEEVSKKDIIKSWDNSINYDLLEKN